MTIAVAAGLAVFSAFTWAFGSLLFGRALRAVPGGAQPPSAAGANLFKNLLAALTFAALWPVLGGDLPGIGTAGMLLLSGLLGFALGDTLYFAALPRAGVQRAAMIGMLNVPMAALLGWGLYGEELPLATLAWMAVVLAGVALVVLDSSEGGGSADPAVRRAGLLFSLANVGSIALAIVLGHNFIDGIDLVPGTLCRMVGGILGAFLVAPIAGFFQRGGPQASRQAGMLAEVRRLVHPLRTRTLWRALGIAAFFSAVLGLLPYHLALEKLPSGVASVLFATTPLFTLPLGLLMGEKVGWRAVTGTLIGYGGVFGVVATLGFAPDAQAGSGDLEEARRAQAPVPILQIGYAGGVSDRSDRSSTHGCRPSLRKPGRLPASGA